MDMNAYKLVPLHLGLCAGSQYDFILIFGYTIWYRLTQEPMMTVDGLKVTTGEAIAKHMLENGPSGSALLNGSDAAQVLEWVAKSRALEV